jgi:hypothetical protein
MIIYVYTPEIIWVKLFCRRRRTCRLSHLNRTVQTHQVPVSLPPCCHLLVSHSAPTNQGHPAMAAMAALAALAALDGQYGFFHCASTRASGDSGATSKAPQLALCMSSEHPERMNGLRMEASN